MPNKEERRLEHWLELMWDNATHGDHALRTMERALSLFPHVLIRRCKTFRHWDPRLEKDVKTLSVLFTYLET